MTRQHGPRCRHCRRQKWNGCSSVSGASCWTPIRGPDEHDQGTPHTAGAGGARRHATVAAEWQWAWCWLADLGICREPGPAIRAMLTQAAPVEAGEAAPHLPHLTENERREWQTCATLHHLYLFLACVARAHALLLPGGEKLLLAVVCAQLGLPQGTDWLDAAAQLSMLPLQVQHMNEYRAEPATHQFMRACTRYHAGRESHPAWDGVGTPPLRLAHPAERIGPGNGLRLRRLAPYPATNRQLKSMPQGKKVLHTYGSTVDEPTAPSLVGVDQS